MIRPFLPERFEGSLQRYFNDGIMPGGFLTAVLMNDLLGAYANADMVSVQELPGLVSWLYNHAPHDCWGSKEKVLAHLDFCRKQKGNAQ